MISIVIPIFNQHDMTDECIRQVLETTQDCELILIDNGSNPPYKPPFSGFIETSVIRNEENKGFPVAVNQGIRAANGDIIVLLNNDVIVTPQWALRLAWWLQEPRQIEVTEFGAKGPSWVPDKPDAFSIIAPCTNYSAGMQCVQTQVYDNIDGLNEAAGWWAREHQGECSEVNFVIGFCMAFKKALWEQIGPFDESLWPCSGEEIDFCLRARAAGHKVGITFDVYVHHEGSLTFKSMDVDYEKLCKRNDAHVAEKWGEFWNKQAVESVTDGIRLNMGCGPFPMEGFVNIDQFEHVNPDLLCDVTKLPYEPGTVSEIYAGHILEHFKFDEGQKALRYWLMLLKPGGKISISVPDYDFLVKEYVKNPTPEGLREFNDIYIYSGIQPSPHQYAYSAALLEKCMKDAGFINIERMPVNHPYFPFAVDWQCGFSGVRP